MESKMTAEAAFEPLLYADLYKKELLGQVIPFWLEHSRDPQHGGFFTCLDRYGKVFDTDKFVWLQGRQVWFFSKAYNEIEPRAEWLEMALLGAHFLKKHGRDAEGHWYFSLTGEGRPLVQPYNIFSDCFAALAFAELHKARPEEGWGDIAQATLQQILQRRNNWKGSYNKSYPGTRPLKGFALPMILCNLFLEFEPLLGSEQVASFVQPLVEEILTQFYKPDLGVLLENVSPEGQFVDCFEGRLVNPGHAIEACWFIMDIGERLRRPDFIDRACKILLQMLEYGWDDRYGGILYFKDVKGAPPQQLEWDQKLWWVHTESLVALAKAYTHTDREEYAHWFNKVHQYTWNLFRDPSYGEWFGYFKRDGERLLDLKGGKWKGCFHVPRTLFQVWKTFSPQTKESK